MIRSLVRPRPSWRLRCWRLISPHLSSTTSRLQIVRSETPRGSASVFWLEYTSTPLWADVVAERDQGQLDPFGQVRAVGTAGV